MIMTKSQKTKLVLISIVFLIAYGVVSATWFVLLPGAPAWVDPNEVGQDEVYALALMQGQTALIRHGEQQPGTGVGYTIVSAPDGFVFDLSESNVLQAAFTPDATGKFYVKLEVRVLTPRRAGLTRVTYAFLVEAALFHDPNVTFEILD